MPEYVPPRGEAQPTACERCNGQRLEYLTRLPKRFDSAFDIFRCEDCGNVNWFPLSD